MRTTLSRGRFSVSRRLSISLSLAALLVVGGGAGEPKQLDGWGDCVDQAGDCKFDVKEGKLQITVPGSEKPHDLSPELASSTAPRVLQPVKGDFVIQVKVDGMFEPGEESKQAGRTSYNGAGLVAFADEKNFIRVERAALQRPGGKTFAYTNFEVRVDGSLQPWANGAIEDSNANKPMWFRLERHGDEVRGAFSLDGKDWTYEAPKKLEAKAWRDGKTTAGVAAISTSTKSFTPVYSDLAITHGDSAAPKGVPAIR